MYMSKPLKNKILYNLIIAFILIACIAISIFAYIAPQNCYAESEYSAKIVNFNQLFNLSHDNYNNYGFQLRQNGTNGFAVSGTPQFALTFDVGTILLVKDHIYYYYSNFDDSDLILTDIGTFAEPQIYSYTVANNTYNIRVRFKTLEYVSTYYYNWIDLTAMYGAGSEPDLAKCKEIFTAQYYSYNLGEPMYEYNLDSMGAIGELYKQEYTIYSSDWKKNDVYETYTQQNTNTNYTEIFTNILSSDEIRTGSVIYTFTSRIPVGAILTFEITNLKNSNFAIYSNTGDELIAYINASSTPSNRKFKVVVEEAPILQIFLMFGGSGISTPAISYETLKITAEYFTTQNELIEGAYASGQQAMKDYYTRPNAGYNEIFNLGKNYGQHIAEQTAGAVTGNAWDFISSTLTSLGSFFSIELMPNITLGTFIAIPLLFGVLFFILKITRGE